MALPEGFNATQHELDLKDAALKSRQAARQALLDIDQADKRVGYLARTTAAPRVGDTALDAPSSSSCVAAAVCTSVSVDKMDLLTTDPLCQSSIIYFYFSFTIE